jgi:DNA polymerase III sliding clamp (beta) subunit (PCNA family)
MAKKGMFIGPSHANGGIPSKIAETNTPIEIEGGEYYICREAFYSPKVFNYQNKTNKQVLDDIYTQFSCKLVQDVMKTNDFIVCKVTVDDPTTHNRKGTVEQILNQMQSENGCRLSNNNQSSTANNTFKKGGLIAPNGAPSNLTPQQYKLVRTPEFKAWFGDWENDPENSSKIVDYNGEPFIVYHGTKNNFSVFDKNKINSNYKQSIGFHFTHSYDHAKDIYAKDNGYVKDVFLNIRNPLLLESKFGSGDEAEETIDNNRNALKQKLSEGNFDGIIAKGANYTKSFVVFNPDQIKLADGTNTTFDGNNPDIRFQTGGSVPIIERPHNRGLRNFFKEKITAEKELKQKGFMYSHLTRAYDKINPTQFEKSDEVFDSFELYTKKLPNNTYRRVIKTPNGEWYYLTVTNPQTLNTKHQLGGPITPSEQEAIYTEWTQLVNMTAKELRAFLKTEEGQAAGLSIAEAKKLSIKSGQESAQWILKMKATPEREWTSAMWQWAQRQIRFIKRMSGNPGALYDTNGNLTRKHTSLLLWGHNPEKNTKHQTPNTNFHNGGPIMKHYITVVKFKTDGKVVVFPAKLNYHDMLSLFSVRENEIEWLNHFDYDTTAKGKHNEFLEWTKTYVVQNFNQPLFEHPIILHKNHPNGGAEIISATAQLKDGTEIEFVPNLMEWKIVNARSFEQGGNIPNAIQLNAFKEASEDTNTPSLFSASTPKRSFAYGGSITNVTKWDDVPNEWRNLKEIKPIDYKPAPTDKGLQKILKPFLGNDFLRPVMSGANFDEDHIAATNAHQLIVLPNPTEKRGIIAVTDLKATDKKVGEVIEGNYPNYIAVIPQPNKQTATHKVDVYKLLQFTKAAINYTNPTTYALRYIVNENFSIGINGKMLIENLQTCLLLGYKEVYFSFEAPSRPIIIHPEKHYNPTKVESFLILQMPVMLFDDEKIASAISIDYDRSLLVQFDFSKNAIVNADGSVATFKMDYGKGELFNENDISLLKKVMPKNPAIAILENIAVKDGKLIATDLATFIKIDQTKAIDGVYGVLNNVPYIDPSVSIDEFPSVRPVKHATKLFTIDAEFFKFIITAALNFVSNDDLRPAMTGINIKKTDDGKIMLAATDANILIRYDITPYLTLHTTDAFDVIFEAKLVKDFLVYNTEPTVDVLFNKEDLRLIITNSKSELNTRKMDERYPDYERVIPTESTSQISFDTTDLLKLISAPTLKAFKDKVNNKQANIHLEGVEAENGKLELYLIATLREHRQDPKIVEVDKIGTIDYALTEKTLPTAQNIALIMPIMSESEKFVFALNPVLLTNMLKDLNTKEEATFGFITKNRAYVLSGPTMAYTKKPATKTKKPTQLVSATTQLPTKHQTPTTKPQPPTTTDIFTLIQGLRLLDQTPEITQLIEGLKLIDRDDDLPF